MQRRGDIIPVFLVFFLVSLVIFFFFHKSIAGLFENLTVPLQRAMFDMAHQPPPKNEVEKLLEENTRLLTELAKQKEIEKENRALRDQFETANPSARTLLPARIIGTGNNLVIIDKGKSEGVEEGSVVVVKDNLVGKVVKMSEHIAVVNLITHKTTFFTAETVKSSSLGVIKGNGGDTIVFGNVVLSDTLEKNDLIQTKGDKNTKGNGYPPGLVVGKVISVHKRSSALFQAAEVKSLVDFGKLETVFIMPNY